MIFLLLVLVGFAAGSTVDTSGKTAASHYNHLLSVCKDILAMYTDLTQHGNKTTEDLNLLLPKEEKNSRILITALKFSIIHCQHIHPDLLDSIMLLPGNITGKTPPIEPKESSTKTLQDLVNFISPLFTANHSRTQNSSNRTRIPKAVGEFYFKNNTVEVAAAQCTGSCVISGGTGGSSKGYAKAEKIPSSPFASPKALPYMALNPIGSPSTELQINSTARPVVKPLFPSGKETDKNGFLDIIWRNETHFFLSNGTHIRAVPACPFEGGCPENITITTSKTLKPTVATQSQTSQRTETTGKVSSDTPTSGYPSSTSVITKLASTTRLPTAISTITTPKPQPTTTSTSNTTSFGNEGRPMF